MKRNRILLSFMTILCVFLVSGVSYAISPDVQAKIFAEENLAAYLKMIVPYYKDFHYTIQDQVMKSYLGDPIKNYIINIEDFDENKNILDQAKPYPFYVFPVMVDGNVITDFTIVLINGEWQVVDIGGHLSKIIYDKSKEIGINPRDNHILRYAGKTFVITKKDGKEIGYAPYLSDLNTGIDKETVTSSDILKKAFVHQKEVLIELKKRSSDPAVRGNVSQGYDFTFKQNKNIFERASKYLRHALENGF